MAPVVDNCCRQVVQTFNLQELQGSKSSQIVVCLSPTWVVVSRCKVSETVNQINGITEENVVINEHLLFFGFVGVQSN